MPARIVINKAFIEGRSLVVSNDCWEWQGSRDGCNYGIFWSGGHELRAHRIAAMLWLGFDLSSPLYVCHKCDNPPCCNPDHLFIGTQKDNMQDSLLKGRHVDNAGEKHGKAKLNAHDVRHIREWAKAGFKPSMIAREYELRLGHVCHIIAGKIWKHLEDLNGQA